MPERLSRASVATCAVLAAAVFGGAYALAHHAPAQPASVSAPPTPIRLADDPVGRLHSASPLPALIVPPRRPKPAQSQPVVTAPAPAVSAPAPVVAAPAPTQAPTPAPKPAPAPKPRRPAPVKPPTTFDDSG